MCTEKVPNKKRIRTDSIMSAQAQPTGSRPDARL